MCCCAARYTNTTRKIYDPCLVRDFSERPPVQRNSSGCALPPAASNSSTASNCSLPVLGTGDWTLCEQMVRRQVSRSHGPGSQRRAPGTGQMGMYPGDGGGQNQSGGIGCLERTRAGRE